MARPLNSQAVLAALKPLTLEELDAVAGGLNDPNEQNNTGGETQIADGAAFQQAQDESPVAVQERFDSLKADFSQDRDFDDQSPAQLDQVRQDIADGRLDNRLGELVDMLRGMSPRSECREIAQIGAGLLDRYADADRPAVLNDLLPASNYQYANAFKVDQLIQTTNYLHGADEVFSVQLLGAAADAYEAAGRTAEASTLYDKGVQSLHDLLIQPFEDHVVTGMLDDGSLSTELFRDGFMAMRDSYANRDTVLEAYRELADWEGYGEALASDPEVQALHTNVEQLMLAEVGGVADTASLANFFSQISGFELGAVDALIMEKAAALPGGLGAFFALLPAGSLQGGALDALVDRLNDAMVETAGANAPWRMIDIMLDMPVTEEIDAHISQFFAAALEGEPNRAEMARLLAAGLIPPETMMAALVHYYDPATDKPTEFRTFLQALAAESGDARPAFAALITAAVFSAVLKESADGTLDAAERTLAAQLLLSDRSLPVSQIPENLRVPVFTAVGLELRAQVVAMQQSGLTWQQARDNVPGIASVLAQLNDAGPAAIGEAIAQMVQGSTAGTNAKLETVVQRAAESTGMALAIMVAVDTNSRIANSSSFNARLNDAMGREIVNGTAVDKLVQSVIAGELTAAQADAVLNQLAVQGSSYINFQLTVTKSDTTAAALILVRDAQLTAELIEARVQGYEAMQSTLKADLQANPSALVNALLQQQTKLGLSGALGQIALVAEASGVDIGATLNRVHMEYGVDVTDAGAKALGALVASGDLTSEQALAAARGLYQSLELHEISQGYLHQFTSEFVQMGAAIGFARLAGAIDDLAGINSQAASELSELRTEFLQLVSSGQLMTDAIKGFEHRGGMFTAELVELIKLSASAAGVFSGSVFIDVLDRLGNNALGVSDALRAELDGMLRNPESRAQWAAQFVNDLREGRQSPAEIASELERLMEHAFARYDLRNNPAHNGLDPARYPAAVAEATNAMRERLAGLDSLVAAVGVGLLNAATSEAAREEAREWFRVQDPSGQLAILRALPSGHSEMTTLRAIADQQLDLVNWSGEWQQINTTISFWGYGQGESTWRMFKTEQVSHLIDQAAELAGMLGESQIDPLINMAKAMGVVITGLSAGNHAYEALFKEKATAFLNADRAETVLNLAKEMRDGEMTLGEIKGEIRDAVALMRLAFPDNQKLYDAVYQSFTGALQTLGMTAAAAESFLDSIESGDALKAAFQKNGVNAAAEVNKLVADAVKNGVSVDYVLVAIYESGYSNVARSIIPGMLEARVANGSVSAELVREIGDGGLSTAKAMEALRDVAAITNRSFNTLLADLVETAEDTRNTTALTRIGSVLAQTGVGEIASSIGADLAAGRVDAHSAAEAVADLARLGNSNIGTAMAIFVASAGAAGASAAAEAIKDLVSLASGSVDDALWSMREALQTRGLTLAAADGAALNALADLYLAGRVDLATAGGLINVLDGTVPDAALLALAERFDALPNTQINADFRAIVSGMLAQRVGSGALFQDLLPQLDTIYRSGQSDAVKDAAYQRLLDFTERAVEEARFAAYYAEAKLHLGVAAAAAAADTLVQTTLPLSEATAAYRLYVAADGAGSGGSGFTSFITDVKGNGSAGRDQVLAGMFLEMAASAGNDGKPSAAMQAHFSEVQADLMQHELRIAEDMRRDAQSLSPAQREAVILQAAGLVAKAAGTIADTIAGKVVEITHSAAADAVLLGTQTQTQLGQEIAGESAKWIVLAGSSHSMALNAYLLYTTAGTGGDPIMLSVAVICTSVSLLMQWDAFRYAIGPGASATIQHVLNAVETARSIAVEAVEAFITSKVDAALGVFDGAKGMYDAFASGKLDDVGPALLKFADNLSSLINIYDMRAQFLALRAGVERAVTVLREAATAIAHVVSEGVMDLRNRDIQYTRTHTFGMSFLPT